MLTQTYFDCLHYTYNLLLLDSVQLCFMYNMYSIHWFYFIRLNPIKSSRGIRVFSHSENTLYHFALDNIYTAIYASLTCTKTNISSRFSENSETSASEFLENLEEISPLYYMYSAVCS